MDETGIAIDARRKFPRHNSPRVFRAHRADTTIPSVPIPKFVSVCGMLGTNFGIIRDTSKVINASVVFGFEVPT